MGFGIALFDAWVLYAAYNLFYPDFTVVTLPQIAFKNFLLFTLAYNVVVSGKQAMKENRKKYELDDPELYSKLFEGITAKLISLGLFWAFTLFF